MARTAEDIRPPEATTREPPATPSTSPTAVLGWAGVVVAVVAAAVLAVVTLTADSDNKPIGHPGLAEHGSIRAIEGSVEDSVRSPGSPVAAAHRGLAEHGSIRAIEGSVEDSADSRNRSDSSPGPGAHAGAE
jgi:hypothetical protein